MTTLELTAQHLDAAMRDLRLLRREQPSTFAEQVRPDHRLRTAHRGVVELEARFAALIGVDRLANAPTAGPRPARRPAPDQQEEAA